LATSIDDLRTSLPEINLISFDVYSLFNEAIENPDKFGLMNVQESCLLIQCSNPNDYLFWDDRHPTTATHRILAQTALNRIKSVPESSSVLGVLVTGVMGTVLTFKRKLNSTEKTRL
jgi:phospholipase/lecithinase/hemolysin